MAEWGPGKELMEGRPCRVHSQEGIECVKKVSSWMKKVSSWMKMSGSCKRLKGKVRINSMKARLYVYRFFKKIFLKKLL